jgi:hypothetical protein
MTATTTPQPFARIDADSLQQAVAGAAFDRAGMDAPTV